MVVISYSSKFPDKACAYAAKEEFEEKFQRLVGPVFMSAADLRSGENWRESILREFSRRKFCIAILSANFKASEWCSQEIGIALAVGATIIPIQIDDTPPFGYLANLQARRVGGPSETKIAIEEFFDPAKRYREPPPFYRSTS